MNKLIFILLSFFVFHFASAQNSIANGCLDLNSNIRQGMKDTTSSDGIYALQSFLRINNYMTVNPTGYFGVQTLKGVKVFQKAHKITATGFVGPLTRAEIKKISCTTNIPEPIISVGSETPAITPIVEVPVVPIESTVPVVEDVILSAPNNSSLRVKTEGVISITTDSLVVRGKVTAGARSGTERWFELTRNPDVYKLSETTISPKIPQRTNNNFEQSFSGLVSGATYYYRACADNISLGQKSCGSSVSITVN